ncbi:MAG TPA: GMC family oxidoreductase [Gammaproteobacteria bacterium]
MAALTGGTEFDAIVVGSGMTGGWAAKELTERGLKTLVLERGKPLVHGRDYVGEHRPPWEVPFRGLPLRELYARDYPVQSTSYAFDENTRHFWNNDRENPYQQDEEAPFDWLRTDVVGGRSLLWGRQVYRWSDLDFTANRTDGHGVDWPIRYADIAPWYAYVERFVGVSGEKLGLAHLPDGEFLRPMELNVVERAFARALRERFPGRVCTIGRVAVLTEPLPGQDHRGVCHYCGPCHRGCSVGAYFSSLSATLPAARATGNLTLRARSVVESLEHDPRTGRVTAVRVVDADTKARLRFTARLVFLCGGTVGSTQVLLNSRSERFPNGLGNDSGVLGRYLMDHTSLVHVTGRFEGFDEYYTTGQRPNGIYIPRFRNLEPGEELPFTRGYGYQGEAYRADWRQMSRRPGFGADFKRSLRRPGPWYLRLMGFGECLPYASNYMELHPTAVDRYGIPQVRFHFQWGENELAQRRDMLEQARAMLAAAGARDIDGADFNARGGAAIHEMGTARMGRDPRESVLNGFNQCHAVPNLFVTDGACMASSSCVNPSITYMALTARAVDYAVRRLRDGSL